MPAIMSSSVGSQSEEQIKKSLFKSFPQSLLTRDHPQLPSLISILRIYGSSVSAEDLFYKTEAVLLSDNTDSITSNVVEQVKNGLKREFEAKVKGKDHAPLSTPAPKQHRPGVASILGTPSSTSHANNRAAVQKPPAAHTSASFAPHIVETLNPHIRSIDVDKLESIMDIDGVDQKPLQPTMTSRVALATETDRGTWDYRYMFERPGIKGQALDDAIESATHHIIGTYSIKDEELGDPAMASQESVYAIGRVSAIVNKDEKSGQGQAKLQDGMCIEISRRIGAASRTPLHFSSKTKLRALSDGENKEVVHSSGNGGQLSLFPGLIAGFRGRNGGGEAFIVEEILMPPSLPLPASPVDTLLQHQYGPTRLNGEPLQLFVASGPYTSDSDLEFGPWHRLMDQVHQQKPDVLLLLGPFLSVSHSALLDPHLQDMPANIFGKHIARRLNRLCEQTSRTTVILLPSTKDIISSHAAWPQPMLDKSSLGLHKRVKCLPNPCLFSINEVFLGASSADVLRDLRSEELVMNLHSNKIGEKDAMARSIRHILHQRHFYPLFPASAASEVPLDVSHAHLAKFNGTTPDLLLLPSVLTPFAKVVDGSVVVNPGQASRGSSGNGGTFAKFQIQAMPRDNLRIATQSLHQNGTDELLQPHNIYQRARVDIVRM